MPGTGTVPTHCRYMHPTTLDPSPGATAACHVSDARASTSHAENLRANSCESIRACSSALREDHRSLASCVASDGTAKRGIATRSMSDRLFLAANTSALKRFWRWAAPAAIGRVMSPVGVSIQVCPGLCPIETSNAQVVYLHGVKVSDVHRHAAVWLGFERFPVSDATAMSTPHCPYRPVAPDVRFGVLGVPGDLDGPDFVERPERTQTPAD